MSALFYLSFANPELPEGSQFLGAAIVVAASLESAVTVSHFLRVNPGGEVCGHRIINELTGKDMEVPQEFVGKLLQAPELDRLTDWAIGL